MPNTASVQGIHHVTAIASDPQANVDFYAGLLGLRLVKKTVNFDDPSAYHLYYGDERGSPGTALTFFYWPGQEARGRVGTGQMTRISFSAPPASLDGWKSRLDAAGVPASRRNRFGEEVLELADRDGIPLEIVAAASDPRSGWTGAAIGPKHALRGFHTAELTVREEGPTAALLCGEMGCRLIRKEGNRARYESGEGGPGTFIDLIAGGSAPAGRGGAGTVHHVAWRTPDDKTERLLQSQIAAAGYHTSPVIDRSYFHSVYYRENGGILFEIATDGPGFVIDEPANELGRELKLPPQFERARGEIEGALPPLRPPGKVGGSLP